MNNCGTLLCRVSTSKDLDTLAVQPVNPPILPAEPQTDYSGHKPFGSPSLSPQGAIVQGKLPMTLEVNSPPVNAPAASSAANRAAVRSTATAGVEGPMSASGLEEHPAVEVVHWLCL